MVTTIQLNENVKKELDKLKIGKRSYEEVILELMEVADKCKREREELLIEGYKEMAEEGLKIAKEWEGALMDGLDKNERW